MASEVEASCIADPNFAVICSFLERFAESCGILHPNFPELQEMLENSEEVDAQLIELHVKLLRKARKSVSAEKWERALAKFGHTYSPQDGWEIERFGYKKSALPTKLRLLKGLLEAQFDLNARFKSAVNKLTASELRTAPLGRDSSGQVYWCQQDAGLNIRIYKEDEDDETWTLISKDRDSLAQLIGTLSGGALNPADLELEDDDAEDELTSSNSQDEEGGVSADILLDTGQPEEAQPPGTPNGATDESASGSLAVNTEDSANGEATNGDSATEKVENTDTMTNSDTNLSNESEKNSVEAQNKTDVDEKPTEVKPNTEAVNLVIPSLMSEKGTKRKLDECDNEQQNKKPKSDEVGEAIEEPTMVVTGEGSGADCNDEPEFGEAVEEPLMFITGVGAGAECDTGNPGDKTDKSDEGTSEKIVTTNDKSTEKTSSEGETTTPPKQRMSRWDNTNISPKAKASTSGAGMVSEWVRPGEADNSPDKQKPSDEVSKPEEAKTESQPKPSIFSPSKSSVWSIDQICGTTSQPPSQPSIFKSGSMFFGNLAKPSFSSSPERTKPTETKEIETKHEAAQVKESSEKLEEEKSIESSLKSSQGEANATKDTSKSVDFSKKSPEARQPEKTDTSKVGDDGKTREKMSNPKTDISSNTTKVESHKTDDSSKTDKVENLKTDISSKSPEKTTSSSKAEISATSSEKTESHKADISGKPLEKTEGSKPVESTVAETIVKPSASSQDKPDDVKVTSKSEEKAEKSDQGAIQATSESSKPSIDKMKLITETEVKKVVEKSSEISKPVAEKSQEVTKTVAENVVREEKHKSDKRSEADDAARIEEVPEQLCRGPEPVGQATLNENKKQDVRSSEKVTLKIPEITISQFGDNLGQSSLTGKPKSPAKTVDDISQPSTGGRPKSPAKSVDISQPSTGSRPKSAKSVDDISQPSTGGRPKSPAKSVDISQPSTGGRPKSPAKSVDDIKSTSGGSKSPAKLVETAKPTEVKSVTPVTKSSNDKLSSVDVQSTSEVKAASTDIKSSAEVTPQPIEIKLSKESKSLSTVDKSPPVKLLPENISSTSAVDAKTSSLTKVKSPEVDIKKSSTEIEAPVTEKEASSKEIETPSSMVVKPSSTTEVKVPVAATEMKSTSDVVKSSVETKLLPTEVKPSTSELKDTSTGDKKTQETNAPPVVEKPLPVDLKPADIRLPSTSESKPAAKTSPAATNEVKITESITKPSSEPKSALVIPEVEKPSKKSPEKTAKTPEAQTLQTKKPETAQSSVLPDKVSDEALTKEVQSEKLPPVSEKTTVAENLSVSKTPMKMDTPKEVNKPKTSPSKQETPPLDKPLHVERPILNIPKPVLESPKISELPKPTEQITDSTPTDLSLTPQNIPIDSKLIENKPEKSKMVPSTSMEKSVHGDSVSLKTLESQEKAKEVISSSKIEPIPSKPEPSKPTEVTSKFSPVKIIEDKVSEKSSKSEPTKLEKPILSTDKGKPSISNIKDNPVNLSPEKMDVSVPEDLSSPTKTPSANEMELLKPINESRDKSPSPSRFSPSQQKGTRRKSLESISMGIMKEKMKTTSDNPMDVEPSSSTKDEVMDFSSTSKELSKKTVPETSSKVTTPIKFEETKYVHKKFSPEEKRNESLLHRNVTDIKMNLEKKLDVPEKINVSTSSEVVKEQSIIAGPSIMKPLEKQYFAEDLSPKKIINPDIPAKPIEPQQVKPSEPSKKVEEKLQNKIEKPLEAVSKNIEVTPIKNLPKKSFVEGSAMNLQKTTVETAQVPEVSKPEKSTSQPVPEKLEPENISLKIHETTNVLKETEVKKVSPVKLDNQVAESSGVHKERPSLLEMKKSATKMVDEKKEESVQKTKKNKEESVQKMGEKKIALQKNEEKKAEMVEKIEEEISPKLEEKKEKVVKKTEEKKQDIAPKTEDVKPEIEKPDVSSAIQKQPEKASASTEVKEDIKTKVEESPKLVKVNEKESLQQQVPCGISNEKHKLSPKSAKTEPKTVDVVPVTEEMKEVAEKSPESVDEEEPPVLEKITDVPVTANDVESEKKDDIETVAESSEVKESVTEKAAEEASTEDSKEIEMPILERETRGSRRGKKKIAPPVLKKEKLKPEEVVEESKSEPPVLKADEESKPEDASKDTLPEAEKEAAPEEVKEEKPVTIGSALTFDYNPPPSPQYSSDDNQADSSLVIDEALEEKRGGRPQRAFRGRGRPPKRGRQPEVTPGIKQDEARPPMASRGRGRGRGPKVRRVDEVAGETAEGDSRESSTLDAPLSPGFDQSPVKRQSRRIAQIKQKEEEERRKAEETALADMQRRREEERRLQALKQDSSSSEESSDTDSDKATNGTAKKKKRKYTKKKVKASNDEDYIGVADEDIRSRRKKKKKRRKKKRKAGVPWESSDTSDSSSQQSEEIGELGDEEEDEETPELKSDHEFSPESDLELGPGEELQEPARRARTARRVSTDKAPKAAKEEEEEDEYRCQKCGAGDRPEWILLCDTCDQGWHTTCLKPELHLVPEGAWFCPTCSHQQLVTALTSTLRELDRSVRKVHNQELRRQRLAYVGISLDNVLPSRGEDDEEEDEDAEDPLQGGGEGSIASVERGEGGGGSGGSESESSSGTPTSSSSESEEEGKYPLRQRRAAATVNYNFHEYDELIKSAIQDEVDAVKGAGNLGRGKDISTIVNAQQQEEAEALAKQAAEGAPTESAEPVTPGVEVAEGEKPEAAEEKEEEDSDEDSDDKKSEDDEEDVERARQHAELVKLSHRRKPRRLACLDISSEDDHASDEDFHGSSEEDEEDDDGFDVDSDDSVAYRRGGSKKSSGPVRRSTRARQTRYDKEFINDSEDSEDERKRKKKSARARGWLGDSDEEIDESELDSESGESDWGSRKKKGGKRRAPTRARAPAKRRKRSGGGGKRKRKGKGRGSKATPKKRSAPVGSGEEGEAPTPKPKKVRAPRPTPPPSPDEPVRRATRGRKINYQEIIGSDSDEAPPTRGKGRRIISDDEDEFRPDEEEEGVAPDLSAVAGSSRAPQAAPPESPTPGPAPMAPQAAPVPVTAATLQTMGGVMPQIVEVGRDSGDSDEDEEMTPEKLAPLAPMAPMATMAPMAPMATMAPMTPMTSMAPMAPMPPMVPHPAAPMPTPVVTPPKTRGTGARRGRGRGRGRPPTIPVMGRMMTKVTVSSPSQDESESDDDIPTTIGTRPEMGIPRTKPDDRVPPAGDDKIPYTTNSGSPQYPPPSQPTGVISRLLQAPLPATSNQPFTAAAAASIAAKFYPPSPNNPQSYPPPRQPRYPQTSPVNYRPPMRLRGGPPNVGLSYPSPSMLDSDKSITPPPPAYVTRPVIQQQNTPRAQGFSPQRPPFQPPPPYQTNPQAPYFNPYPVDDPPQQFQPPYAPPDTFTNPQDPPSGYETAPPVSRQGDEEGGEFGGLVSYFSSQREDDLES